LRDPELSIASFGRLLKTYLSAELGVLWVLEALCDNALYKLTDIDIDIDKYDMRQNICTLWSLISCYPSDNDVIVIVQWTLLYNIAIACYLFLFASLLSCFLTNKDI